MWSDHAMLGETQNNLRAASLAEHVNCGMQVLNTTIRRQLTKCGFFRRVARRIPHLSKKNIKSMTAKLNLKKPQYFRNNVL